MTVIRIMALTLALFCAVEHTRAEFSVAEEDYILKQLLRSIDAPEKRQQPLDSEFNNCPEDEPFPCKSTNKCISLKHVCDGNYDCPERWDEDQEVCIAYQRVPAEDMLNFVEQQARWLIPAFFKSIVKSRDDLQKIASALSTSANIDVFQSKLHLSRQSARDFESALYAVRSNDMGTLERFGMKPESWSEVKSVFKNLIDSGLLQQ